MRSITPLIVAAALMTACTSQTEYMAKGGLGAEGGRDIYFYHLGQIGGQVIAKNSMGTSLAADDQKSFADAATAWVSRGLSLDATKVQLSKEVTARYTAGQITIQQQNALLAGIENMKTQADVTKFLAALPK